MPSGDRRAIPERLAEDVAFRVLAARNEPDLRTIADFRRRYLAALEGLFVQVLRLARETGALSVGRVAIDGSKVRANASKHKAVSYGRMVDKERQLAQEVHHWLTQAEATDAQEDAEHGRDRRGDELPEDLRRRETRLARIREAKRVLEERAKAEAPVPATDAEAKPVTPKEKAQYNFTDPESRIMKGPDGFVQAYNVQIAVEATCPQIVGHAVTQEVNDKRQLAPMIETVTAQAGVTPDEVLADNRDCSEANLEYVRDQGSTPTSPPTDGRTAHRCRPCGDGCRRRRHWRIACDGSCVRRSGRRCTANERRSSSRSSARSHTGEASVSLSSAPSRRSAASGRCSA